jgi:hypothetical protein
MEGDEFARNIAYMWDRFNTQRRPKIEEWKELRNYIFATDTTTTTNMALPWKNSTTLPKLCQLRDNLHSNYLSALFPNDQWMKWVGYTLEDSVIAKTRSIENYMRNKTLQGGFNSEVSKLLYDFIDYGNCFVTCDFVNRTKMMNDREVPSFIGPIARRISPYDIVFDPTCRSFTESFKIIRSIKTIGELKAMAEDEPDNRYLQEAVAERDEMQKLLGSYSIEDDDRAEGYSFDGFGNLHEYYMSNYVEILEFWGDYHDSTTGTIERNKIITVVDRRKVIRNDDIPSWLGSAPIYHVSWRKRPDNLWGMGPLDNLVGMQYRIDHLENLKADAMDLCVHPPLKVIGEVEEFEYGPGEEIHIDEGGDVQELARNTQWVIQADNEIGLLENRMELYAGAPREAMGVRSPGEKTAFEVQRLEAASGRIFQEKINTFEIEVLEPLLNAMLSTSIRNLDLDDTIRVLDDDVGTEIFINITRDDITASGTLRPVGARHFAAQAQLIQNLTGIFNSPIGQMIQPHTSAVNMPRLVEDSLGVGRYELFTPGVAVQEQQNLQRAAGAAQEDLAVEEQMADPGEEPPV